MSGYIERTTVSEVGRPVAASLETLPDARTLGVISLGGVNRITSTSASWLRDLVNAAGAVANVMEAEQQPAASAVAEQPATPDVALPEGITEVTMKRACNGCGNSV